MTGKEGRLIVARNTRGEEGRKKWEKEEGSDFQNRLHQLTVNMTRQSKLMNVTGKWGKEMKKMRKGKGDEEGSGHERERDVFSR